MSAPVKQDAAFRYTESGQSYIHYLGARLRRPVADKPERTDRFVSGNKGNERRITIVSVAEDLRATLRYEGMTESLRGFIAAARRGASLEYFPSISNPAESYPCTLHSDSGVDLDRDLWWEQRNSVRIVLRRTDGGTWQRLTSGSLFYYRAGNALPGLTFARSGAVGSAIGADGLLEDYDQSTFRTHWIDTDGDGIVDTPVLLLEPAGTNVYDFSDDLSDASWSKTRSSVSQNAGLRSPKGVASAASGVFALIEDSATGVHYFEQTLPALADDTNQVTSFWARASSRSVCFIQTINKANRTDTSFFNLSTGALGSVDGDHVSVRIRPGPISGAFRWYRVTVVWDAGSGGTTPRAILGLTNADGTASYTGDGSSQIIVWNPMFEVDTDVPSSDIVTDSATDVTRDAETFVADFPYTPDQLRTQGVTVYLKLRETGVSDVAGLASTALNIGAAADFIRLYRSPGNNRYGIGSDISGQGAFPVVSSPAPGEWVEIVGKVNPNGSLDAETSVEEATPVTASEATPGTWPESFGAAQFRLGSQSGSVGQPLEVAEIKSVLGVDRTLVELRAL